MNILFYEQMRFNTITQSLIEIIYIFLIFLDNESKDKNDLNVIGI